MIQLKRAFARYCTEVLDITEPDAMRAEFEAFTAMSSDPYIDTLNLLLHEEPNWRGYFECVAFWAQQNE
jgi:hypothetical protein